MTPRRALWLFRLIFYPAAVLAAVLLLSHRGAADETFAPTGLLNGETAQHFAFAVSVGRDGKPLHALTRVRATCPDGVLWTISWRPVITTWHARQSWDWRYPGEVGHIVLTMRADPATHRGTLTFTERFTQPSGYRFTCASGPVAFSWPR